MSRTPSDFAVPVARAPVGGGFVVPPSKSLHQRALVLAALSDGPSEVVAGGAAGGEDVAALSRALDAMGPWAEGALGASRESLVLDLKLGATGFRFAIAAATLRPSGARTLLRGRRPLLLRPHRPLLRALVRLGARAKRRHSGAVRVVAGRVRGAPLAVPGRTSSQYASALLLIGPRIGGIDVTVLPPRVSSPYLSLTREALAAFGVPVETPAADAPGAERIRVPAVPPRGARYVVPPDASAAAAWWAAAALTGGRTWVEGLGRTSSQPDVRLLAVLERMGARVDEAEGTARVAGPSAPLEAPGEVDLTDAPDLLPLVSVLAASARGTTRVVGVAHARAKETDRVLAVARALGTLGIGVEVEGDDLVVRGGRPAAGTIDVRDDHRMAFAFGVLGLAVPGIVLRGARSAAKSHPTFLSDLVRASGEGRDEG